MKKLLLLLLIVLTISFGNAQQKAEQFNIPVNYLLSLPDDYGKDTAKQWPLMIFLHGSGERGDDVNKVAVHGPPKLAAQGKKFPFIIVSPQATLQEGWEPEILIRLIRGIESKYKVDKERIYLTGLSMGGFGTWKTAMKFPWVFAAIAPICGGGDTVGIEKLKHMPVWCFHGAKDDVVKPEQSYRMVNALKKYNPGVKLTVYPEANHDSWTVTYNNDSLYEWFLQQKKFHYSRKTLSDSELKQYSGVYVRGANDSLTLIAQDGKLLVKDQPQIEVVPYEKDGFYVSVGEMEIEVRYVRNRNGRIDKLVVMDETPAEFRKVK